MYTYKIAHIIESISGYKTEIISAHKDGEMREGIVVHKGDVSPVFYPHRYDGNDTHIAYQIIRDLINMAATTFDTSIAKDWDKAKKNIFVGLRPVTDDNVATRKFLDLEMYLYLVFSEDASAKLTQENINSFGIPANKVWNRALINTENDTSISTMNSFMDFDCDLLEQVIITNSRSFRGASCMIFKATMNKVAGMLNSSELLIIPSSIHEVIVSPIFDDDMIDYVKEMIPEINASSVPAGEELSTHPYIYSVKNGFTWK